MTNLLLASVIAGQIVVHAAMPSVLDRYPDRADPGVEGYIAVNDCAELGNRYVLVRPGQPDVLVAVADCAWAYHVPYRQSRNLIADVDEAIWAGPWRPQYAELWPVAERAEYWATIKPAARRGEMVLQ